MDDSARVRGVERVGHLHADFEKRADVQPAPDDVVLQRLALQQLHGDEALADRIR